MKPNTCGYCGQGPSKELGPLVFVPADTPYHQVCKDKAELQFAEYEADVFYPWMAILIPALVFSVAMFFGINLLISIPITILVFGVMVAKCSDANKKVKLLRH